MKGNAHGYSSFCFIFSHFHHKRYFEMREELQNCKPWKRSVKEAKEREHKKAILVLDSK